MLNRVGSISKAIIVNTDYSLLQIVQIPVGNEDNHSRDNIHLACHELCVIGLDRWQHLLRSLIGTVLSTSSTFTVISEQGI